MTQSSEKNCATTRAVEVNVETIESAKKLLGHCILDDNKGDGPFMTIVTEEMLENLVGDCTCLVVAFQCVDIDHYGNMCPICTEVAEDIMKIDGTLYDAEFDRGLWPIGTPVEFDGNHGRGLVVGYNQVSPKQSEYLWSARGLGVLNEAPDAVKAMAVSSMVSGLYDGERYPYIIQWINSGYRDVYGPYCIHKEREQIHDCGSDITIPLTLSDRMIEISLGKYINCEGETVLLEEGEELDVLYKGTEVQIRTIHGCRRHTTCVVCTAGGGLGNVYQTITVHPIG